MLIYLTTAVTLISMLLVKSLTMRTAAPLVASRSCAGITLNLICTETLLMYFCVCCLMMLDRLSCILSHICWYDQWCLRWND